VDYKHYDIWLKDTKHYYGHYDIWLKDPKHYIPSAQLVHYIVGQDILNSDVGNYFQGTTRNAKLSIFIHDYSEEFEIYVVIIYWFCD